MARPRLYGGPGTPHSPLYFSINFYILKPIKQKLIENMANSHRNIKEDRVWDFFDVEDNLSCTKRNIAFVIVHALIQVEEKFLEDTFHTN